MASTVWVLSGHYSFRFDRNEVLGRIRPFWVDKFPVKTTGGFTAILLKIDDASSARTIDGTAVSQKIIDALLNFQPAHLLFLSQVKEIDINVPHGCTVAGIGIRRSKRRTIRVDAIPHTYLSLLPITLHSGGGLNDEQLLAFRYLVDTSHLTEPERPGCDQSEIILVFNPRITSYDNLPSKTAYAFLPIKESVLKVRL